MSCCRICGPRKRDLGILRGPARELSAGVLLSGQHTDVVLADGRYAYRVRGGTDGYLYYKRITSKDWILIANRCFYGLYIVVRYRKPLWLRPMYQSLFGKMNFVSVTFLEHSIQLVGRDGKTLRSDRLRLSPPSALVAVMTRKFGYSHEQVEQLKAELDWD